MDILKIKVFLYAIDSGSLTKAAARYNYTPSGVSHMMTALEKEVGFPLFIRTNTGIVPTENAQKLLPIMRAQCRWEEQFSQTVSEIKGLVHGSLSIAAYSSIASQWLPEVIREFHKDYPSVSVNILDGVWQEVENSLQEGKADIGFYSYQPSIRHQWIPLREDPMVAAVPLDHPLAKKESVRLEDIEKETLIMPAYGADVDVLHVLDEMKNLDERGARKKQEWKFATLQNYSAMGMVEQGLGVLVMNELITKGRTLSLKILPLDPYQSVTLGMAIPMENRKTPAVAKFAEYAEQILRK